MFFATLNATDNNNLKESLPSEIGLLTLFTDSRLGKWKYLVDELKCLKVYCVANHILSVFVSYHKLLIFFSAINIADNNDFTRSLPSEIGLLAGLTYLRLGKWMYLVDHFDCLKVSCCTNYILSEVDSHHK